MTTTQRLAVVFGMALMWAAPARAAEPEWAGVWRLAERKTELRFFRAPSGAAQAEVVVSPNREDVGTRALRDLKWDESCRAWSGELVLSDVGRAQVTLRVVDPNTVEMVAGRWFLKKTLRLTRVVTAEGVKP